MSAVKNIQLNMFRQKYTHRIAKKWKNHKEMKQVKVKSTIDCARSSVLQSFLYSRLKPQERLYQKQVEPWILKNYVYRLHAFERLIKYNTIKPFLFSEIALKLHRQIYHNHNDTYYVLVVHCRGSDLYLLFNNVRRWDIVGGIVRVRVFRNYHT